MKANKQVYGLDFFELLSIVFIALKLTGFIDWSWWWVLAPLWGPLLFVVLVVLPMFLYVNKR